MSRRAAKITQADVARVLRAAKQVGAVSVEVTAEGTIRVFLVGPYTPAEASNENNLDPKAEIVL